MRPRLLLLGVVLVLAGCGSTGTTVRDEGPAALGDKAIVSPAAAVGEDTAAAVPAVPASGSGFVYLLRYDQPEPTRRSIPSDLTVPEGSLRALLEGPSLAERVLDYSSAIPEDSRLLGYSALNRTAIVDLTKLPPIAADAQSEALLALYQIVYTVTASDAIEAVQVRLNGRPYGLNAVAVPWRRRVLRPSRDRRASRFSGRRVARVFVTHCSCEAWFRVRGVRS